MEKRFVIAVVLCVALLVVWQKLFPTHVPAPPPPPPQTAPSAQTTPAAPAVPAGPAAPATGPAAAAPPAAPAPNRPEREVELVTAQQRFVFSTLGGTLRHAQLLEHQFL